jgi:hypothetical protein
MQTQLNHSAGDRWKDALADVFQYLLRRKTEKGSPSITKLHQGNVIEGPAERPTKGRQPHGELSHSRTSVQL